TELDNLQFVNRLDVGAYPPLQRKCDLGLKGRAAIFYTLAAGFDRSLFDVVAEQANDAAAVVSGVKRRLSMWSDARDLTKGTVRESRRRLVKDEMADALYAQYHLAHLRKAEDIQVSFSASYIHGDLHCGNVLVDAGLSP